MMDMMIREAKAQDAIGICTLYQEVMQYEYPVEKTAEKIRQLQNDHCNHAFVALIDGSVVGIIETVIKCSLHKESYLTINTLAVREAFQGQGIGSALLAYAERFAIERHLGSISVGSQLKRARAHQFYEKNGFQNIKLHKIFEKKIVQKQ